MRHWSRLATRNWRAKPTRTFGIILAIALGTAAVVWVTCCFESVRRTVLTWARQYVGTSQLTVESPLGKYDVLPLRLADVLMAIPEVQSVTPRLVQRLRGVPAARPVDANLVVKQRWTNDTPEVDVHGVDIELERLVRDYPLKDGRMLTADDRFAAVVEAGFAEEYGKQVGDSLLLWGGSRADDEPYELEIVGLVERRRIARFQKAQAVVPLTTLQQIALKQGSATSLDVILRDQNDRNIRRVTEIIRGEVRKRVPNATVRDVRLRLQQIQNAQNQQEFVLVLLSCVAMLTGLFIILSTLSMGMVERIAQLGLMRCIGLTGGQLALLMLVEVIPLGVIGVALGVPMGLGLTALTVSLVPEYVGAFPIRIDEIAGAARVGVGALLRSVWDNLWSTGIVLAATAGLATTLAATLLPILAAVSVTPLEASRPRARRGRRWLMFATAAGALLVLGLQYSTVYGFSPWLHDALTPASAFLQAHLGFPLPLDGLQRSPTFLSGATLVIVLLYLGYALLAPLVVWVIGSSAVLLTARLARVHTRLLQDQVGYAVWRSAGICCGLMVGLSLIVGLAVFSESVRNGWEFPKQFPEAYVWSFQQMRPDAEQRLRAVPGVRNFTAANAMNVIVEERPLLMEKVFLSVTWFLGIDPESFFDLVRLEFVEGERATAQRLMRQGGHVLVAEDFARTRNKHLGDTVKVFVGQRQHLFKIAGVVQSPALDIAAGYFQAHSEMNVVAVGSVMGANADMRRLFNVDGVKLVLLNFDLPPETPPAGWPPPRDTAAAAALGAEAFDERLPLASRWQRWREEQVLRAVAGQLENPQAFRGTVRELKDEIDRELTRVTRLLSAVPAVALIVAAIGVANLMTASVTSRARQLAILRAVGATRGLILRMVIGEALVLGVLGSVLGLALGLHLAHNTTTMTERMWGMAARLQLPWEYIMVSVALTIGLCVLAGIMPARHASRTNVVDALRVQ
ncbi:MAG: ABC transporter permease [Phycisphaerae bacterium]